MLNCATTFGSLQGSIGKFGVESVAKSLTFCRIVATLLILGGTFFVARDSFAQSQLGFCNALSEVVIAIDSRFKSLQGTLVEEEEDHDFEDTIAKYREFRGTLPIGDETICVIMLEDYRPKSSTTWTPLSSEYQCDFPLSTNYKLMREIYRNASKWSRPCLANLRDDWRRSRRGSVRRRRAMEITTFHSGSIDSSVDVSFEYDYRSGRWGTTIMISKDHSE